MQLGDFLAHFLPHAVKRVPLEPGGRGLARYLLRLHERGEAGGHAVQQAFAPLARTVGRLVGGALLRHLHPFPQIQHVPGVGGLRLAEHVRMAADHLLVHVGAHVVDVELAGIGSYLALQHHLQQHVAQLLAQVRDIGGFDGVHRLVCLFDHVVRDALVRLRAIPRASVRRAQRGDGGDELVERRMAAGVGRKLACEGRGRRRGCDGRRGFGGSHGDPFFGCSTAVYRRARGVVCCTTMRKDIGMNQPADTNDLPVRVRRAAWLARVTSRPD